MSKEHIQNNNTKGQDVQRSETGQFLTKDSHPQYDPESPKVPNDVLGQNRESRRAALKNYWSSITIEEREKRGEAARVGMRKALENPEVRKRFIEGSRKGGGKRGKGTRETMKRYWESMGPEQKHARLEKMRRAGFQQKDATKSWWSQLSPIEKKERIAKLMAGHNRPDVQRKITEGNKQRAQEQGVIERIKSKINRAETKERMRITGHRYGKMWWDSLTPEEQQRWIKGFMSRTGLGNKRKEMLHQKNFVLETISGGRVTELTPKEEEVLMMRYVSLGGTVMSYKEMGRILGRGGKRQASIRRMVNRALRKIGYQPLPYPRQEFSPQTRVAHRTAMRKPEVRRKISEGVRKFLARNLTDRMRRARFLQQPEIRRRQGISLSRTLAVPKMRIKWSEVQRRSIDIHRARAKKQWESKTSKERETEVRRLQSHLKRPEVQERRIAALKLAYQDPLLLRKLSDAQKKRWNEMTDKSREEWNIKLRFGRTRPEAIEKQRAGIQRWWNSLTPEERDQKTKHLATAYQQPGVNEKVRAGIKQRELNLYKSDREFVIQAWQTKRFGSLNEDEKMILSLRFNIESLVPAIMTFGDISKKVSFGESKIRHLIREGLSKLGR